MDKLEAKEKYKQLIRENASDNYNTSDSYCEIHHIIPRSEGGKDDKSNLVTLKYVDHVLAHYYLAIIFDDEYMLKAFSLMTDISSKLLPEEKEIIENLPYYSELREKSLGFNNRKIYQYDLEGSFIAEYNSIYEAAENLSLKANDIYLCVKKRVDQYKNYIWSFKKVDKLNIRTNNIVKKKVIQYDLEGDFIAEYESASEAKRKTGIYPSSAARGVCKTAGGYVWKYADS